MVARKYGVVYTPDRLADFAAELLCSEIEESKFDNIKVLDPACGECALLDSVKKIKGKGYEYIGIDVDKTAILSASREYTIINNDTILPKNVRKKTAEFWAGKLPVINAIIANPPWSSEKIYNRDDLRNAGFELTVGQYDSFVLFLELAYKMICENGVFAFIIPDSIFDSQNENLRRFLTQNTEIKVIARLGEKLFDEVNRATTIIVCKKRKPTEQSITKCFRLSTDNRKKYLLTDIQLMDIYKEFVNKDTMPDAWPHDIGLEEIFRGERRGVIDTEPFRLQFIDNKECPFGDYSIMGIEEDRITSGCNVLLYGVPGSGKSWTIEHEYCKKETNVERLVFHPDYTYSDFIGQILPNVDDDGQVSYKFTSGPFTNILADAYRNPEKEYILIIEEINRGNAPAIFGEVFQLLDRKTEIRDFDDDGYPVGTSEYGITNANIAKIVYGDPKHKVRIPSNLSILGTMNTSDQNVFTLDTAFQRRWEMRLIENNFEHVDRNLADAVILDTGITWEVFCTQINNIIVGNNARMTSAEDKRLGAYFVHLRDLRYDQEMGNLSDGEYDNLRRKEEDKSITEAEKERLDTIRNAMKQNRKFPEKVIKYLWDDAFKFNREVVFETSQFQSLEQVIRTFMYAEKMDRFVMFKENVRAAFTNPEE